MDALRRLPDEHARELQRLCELYENAKERAALGVARDLRGAISDYVGKISAGDARLEAELRQSLGFPNDPSPLALDQ